MQYPLQISFQGLEPSAAIEAKIHAKVRKLEDLYKDIISCRVAVAAPHKHHQQGRLFSVHIDLKVPGGEVIINKDHHLNHAHEDAYVAIRDAFAAARRQLEEYKA